MLERKADEFYRFVQIHKKTGHIGVCNRYRVSRVNLVDKLRYNRASGTHYISVSRAADDCTAPLSSHTGIGVYNMFHHRFTDSHGVDRIGSFVC